MPVDIDIVATTLGAARPVAILGHGGRSTAFHAYPSSRFGFPLSLSEFKMAGGNHYRASYAATIGKFPGRTPVAMLYGIVAGHDEALIYDRFGLAAHLNSGKTKVIRKKLRVAISLVDLGAALNCLPLTPLGPISGKTVTCPACTSERVRLKSFLDGWKRSGRSYIQMPLCESCASMVSGRQWLGTAVCQSCGTRVREDAHKCKLCGEYPFAAKVP
jgi:ribosomal protein L40E